MAKVLIGNLRPPIAKTDTLGISKPDGTTIGIDENGTLSSLVKASGLDITDTKGLTGEENSETNTQALIDAIANKVINELVSKNMISTTIEDSDDKVASTSLVYQLNSDLSSVSDELETVTANLSDVEAQAEAQKYSEDETDHSETVYSLFKNSISYWGNFHNLTYHFRISDNADSTFGNGHFVAYIFRDNAGAVFSAFIINKWTADAWSMIFTSYDEAKYIKKLS